MGLERSSAIQQQGDGPCSAQCDAHDLAGGDGRAKHGRTDQQHQHGIDGHDDARMYGTRRGKPIEKQELIDRHPREAAQPQPAQIRPRHPLPTKRVQQPKQRRRPRHAQRNEPRRPHLVGHQPLGHQIVVGVDQPHAPQGQMGLPRCRLARLCHVKTGVRPPGRLRPWPSRPSPRHPSKKRGA